MTITEKVSYLKGLAEGLGLDESLKQDKLIKVLIDTMEDMALTISDLEDTCADLTEQLDAVDEDLANLEDEVYEYDGDEDGESEDGEFYEVECPACGDTIYLDEDTVEEGGIDCPNCGTELEFDFSGDDENCSCGRHQEADSKPDAE